MPSASTLPQTFYLRSPELVAPALLGKVLVHQFRGKRLSGRIVETEAYLGRADPASHAFTAKSPFNDVLYGPAGRADVYLIYGLHYCLNVSCLPDGEPGGVLFRALLPIEGVETMAKLRRLPPNASAKLLTGGPGKLCQALGITRASHHGMDLTQGSSALHIVDDDFRPEHIEITPRIGIRKAADLPLRFLITAKKRS
jgi:DNA-3-methyladenine glycosylase